MPRYVKSEEGDFSVLGEVDLGYFFPEFVYEEEIVNPPHKGRGFNKSPYVNIDEIPGTLSYDDDEEEWEEDIIPVSNPRHYRVKGRKSRRQLRKAVKKTKFQKVVHGKFGRPVGVK